MQRSWASPLIAEGVVLQGDDLADDDCNDSTEKDSDLPRSRVAIEYLQKRTLDRLGAGSPWSKRLMHGTNA